MFEPFPTNYVWNLSINLALEMGGAIGDIDLANRETARAAEAGDSGVDAFFDTWLAMADRVGEMAQDDEAAGNLESAAAKYRRSCAYLITAERMQASDYPPRMQAYADMLATFARYVACNGEPCEMVEIPYADSHYPALFCSAATPENPSPPCMVFCNGLDSVKEMVFLVGLPKALRARGISCLIVDQPGVGGALRANRLPAIVETELWAGKAVDWLEGRADVASGRIGMMGWSLGGYYAPRAAAFEKRFRLCVAWGANHEWGLVQQRRRRNEGENPVPHYWAHVMWVWGQTSLEDFMALSERITLTGVVEQIDVPFLVVHGENDRQIPLEYAYRSHEQAVRSPRADLKIFTPREGGIEHCSADNMEPVRSFIADWIRERFIEMI
ncbi:alpha/beta fold hydrolase [Novosphingobium sp. SG707]|uniref:alpha/beta hydrolase family protein n=1 Tax=Novosphingobium sp. SG707 TaxID=2586996 RepID=UPI001446806D|nr:alpha/beta fold hydrolase [Novosphingobium sp. SG707]NKJ00934.1 pimeloyl-ACP methyl ester carboxylesterase [Novosphingobium sp. SG707]